MPLLALAALIVPGPRALLGQEASGAGAIEGTMARMSPDGSTIVFLAERDGSRDLHVVRSDGSHPTPLTSGPDNEGPASWAPDGERLVFTRGAWPHQQVFVMRADGSGAHPVTDGPENHLTPSWSVDGERIVYSVGMWPGMRIETAEPDGSDPVALSDGRVTDWWPVWSPDGRRLAFASDDPEDDGPVGVFVMNPDGTGRRPVADTRFPAEVPAWSPDGATLAYQSTRDGNTDIYLRGVDGGPERRLTRAAGLDEAPSFTPDGGSILFQSDRGGNLVLYRVELDDGAVTPVGAAPSTRPTRSAVQRLLDHSGIESIVSARASGFTRRVAFAAGDLTDEELERLVPAVRSAFAPALLRSDVVDYLVRDAPGEGAVREILSWHDEGANGQVDEIADAYEPPLDLSEYARSLLAEPPPDTRVQLVVEWAEAQAAGEFYVLMEQALAEAAREVEAVFRPDTPPFTPLAGAELQQRLSDSFNASVVSFLRRFETVPDTTLRAALDEYRTEEGRWYVGAYSLAVAEAIRAAGRRTVDALRSPGG